MGLCFTEPFYDAEIDYIRLKKDDDMSIIIVSSKNKLKGE